MNRQTDQKIVQSIGLDVAKYPPYSSHSNPFVPKDIHTTELNPTDEGNPRRALRGDVVLNRRYALANELLKIAIRTSG
jgi:hypothetical protein